MCDKVVDIHPSLIQFLPEHINRNLGELFKDLFCGGGGGDKITPVPCLKLFRIILET